MESIQSDLLTFEAIIAAMARIDNLWNIFLAANLTFIGGSVLLERCFKAWELSFFIFGLWHFSVDKCEWSQRCLYFS